MKQYLQLGAKLAVHGRAKPNRTGVGTIGLFGEQMRFNLQDGFPLCTTKLTIFESMIHELVWFLEGSTDNKRLNELGARFWNAWALKEDYVNGDTIIKQGELGPIYGKQWRDFGGVDQIKELIDNLKNKPFSRRHIVSAWNPPELANDAVDPQQNIKDGKMALSPCHCLFQYYVDEATFQERKAHFELKCFSHEVKVDTATLLNRIFATTHAKDFVTIEENYREENKVDELPRDRILSFCSTRNIPSNIYKPLKSYVDRVSFLENSLDSQSFQEMLSKYREIDMKHGNPHNEARLKAVKELLDSYNAPECMDDIATLSELLQFTSKESLITYYESIFDRYKVPKYRLSCQLYQRSADYPVGVPVNIASYSLLTMMVAQVVDMIPGDFVHTFGDVHIYDDQIELFVEQLKRTPYELPRVHINPEVKDIFAFRKSDFKLMNYFCHPKIVYPVAT